MAGEYERAVVVMTKADAAALLLSLLARQLLGFLAAAIRTHEPLDVRGGAVLGNGQQVVLVVGIADARDLAGLGVAELAAGHGGGHLGQGLERAGDAHLLARGAEGDAALPVQPVGAGLRGAVRPAVAPVELGDQDQETMIGGVDVTGKGADLGGEFVDGAHGDSACGLWMRTVYARTCVDAGRKLSS